MTERPGQGRPATMSDLARLAGVSVTTVSHVLNDTRFVSADARQRVLAAVRETGYTPNFLARSMKTSATNTIGLAAPALSKVALAELVRPIEAVSRALDLSILLTDTEDDPVAELAAVEALHGRRVDGIIIAPSRSGSPAMDYLSRHAIPTVVVDRFTTGEFDQIGTENVGGARKLTEHLLGTGHRRVAMVFGMPGLSTTVERTDGYRQALAAAGLEVDPDLIAPGWDDPARYRPVLERMLGLPDPPTGVVSANNATTIGIMRAVGAMGLRVPDDLALVGFDDFEWADVFHPRLTVVRQRMDDIGARAVHMLQRRIADPDAPVSTHLVPTDFVHRDSCGCPD